MTYHISPRVSPGLIRVRKGFWWASLREDISVGGGDLFAIHKKVIKEVKFLTTNYSFDSNGNMNCFTIYDSYSKLYIRPS